MEKTTLSRAEKLDRIFGTPVYAVLLAIFCNVLWGSAFPFIKLGYRLFSIDSGNTASIFCFAGVRFMLGSFLVLLGSVLLQNRLPKLPRGKVAAECCALGLWQTTTQYAFYYIAVAMLTGAFGGILNSTQSFLGVIFAHFLYGNADRMTPAKTLGCAVGFAGVLIGTLGNHGGGSSWGIFCMLLATVIFTLSGPWNKAVTKKADSFAVCFINLFVGGAALFVLGTALGGHLGSVNPLGILVLLYLAFICGAGYVLWALLMKNNPVSRIAIFGFVNLVVNVLLSAVLNGEPLLRCYAYTRLAVVRLRQHRPGDAVELADHAATYAHDHAALFSEVDALHVLGQALLVNGEPERAREQWTRAIDIADYIGSDDAERIQAELDNL